MEKTIVITLTQHDITALNGMAKGNLSYVIRDMISEYDIQTVSEFLKTDRKACRFDVATEQRLDADAEKLGTSKPALIRAIIESKLNSMH